jgi:hypothetical protein
METIDTIHYYITELHKFAHTSEANPDHQDRNRALDFDILLDHGKGFRNISVHYNQRHSFTIIKPEINNTR